MASRIPAKVRRMAVCAYHRPKANAMTTSAAAVILAALAASMGPLGGGAFAMGVFATGVLASRLAGSPGMADLACWRAQQERQRAREGKGSCRQSTSKGMPNKGRLLADALEEFLHPGKESGRVRARVRIRRLLEGLEQIALLARQI